MYLYFTLALSRPKREENATHKDWTLPKNIKLYFPSALLEVQTTPRVWEPSTPGLLVLAAELERENLQDCGGEYLSKLLFYSAKGETNPLGRINGEKDKSFNALFSCNMRPSLK